MEYLSTLKIKIEKLVQHQGFRKYFANTSWLFVGRFFQMGVSLFVGVWVARYLGPSKYGLLNFSKSFVGLFVALSTLGLDGIVIRELVKDESRRDVLLGTSFFLKLVGAVMAIIVISIAIYLTSADYLTRLMVLIVAFSLVFRAFNVIDLYFQSKVLSKFSVFSQISSATLSAIVKIILISYKASVIWFAIMAVFDMITIGIGYLYFYSKENRLPLKKWKFKWSCAKSLLKDSWPLILSGIAINIYMRIDQVMIKYMLTDSAVGLYSVAVRLCEVWYIVPVLITKSLFPAIINAKKVSKRLYYKRLEKLYTLIIWIAILITLFLILFRNLIVSLAFGPYYEQSKEVLFIYSLSNIFVYLSVVNGYYLINENYAKLGFFRTFITATTNIFLNLILIPKFGINGAAISTLISYFFLDFSIIIFPKTYNNTIVMIRALFGVSLIRNLKNLIK